MVVKSKAWYQSLTTISANLNYKIKQKVKRYLSIQHLQQHKDFVEEWMMKNS